MIVLNVIDDAAQAELLKSISYLSHNKVYFWLISAIKLN